MTSLKEGDLCYNKHFSNPSLRRHIRYIDKGLSATFIWNGHSWVTDIIESDSLVAYTPPYGIGRKILTRYGQVHVIEVPPIYPLYSDIYLTDSRRHIRHAEIVATWCK